MGNGEAGPERDPLGTLRALGYVAAAQEAVDPQATAVRSYQYSRRLAVSSELDPETVTTLNDNFCSVPPRGKPGSDPAMIAPPWVLPSDGSPLRLSFQFGEGFPAGADSAIRSAMQTWEGALQVEFVPFTVNGRPAPQVLFEWVVDADPRLDGATNAYVTPPPPYRPLSGGLGLQPGESVHVRFNGREGSMTQRAPSAASIFRASRSMNSAMCSVSTTREAWTLSCHPCSTEAYNDESSRSLTWYPLPGATRRGSPSRDSSTGHPFSSRRMCSQISTSSRTSYSPAMFFSSRASTPLRRYCNGSTALRSTTRPSFLGIARSCRGSYKRSCLTISISSRYMLACRGRSPFDPTPDANGTIRFVELADVVDQLDIGMQGENRTAMIIRPTGRVDLHALYQKVGQLRQVPTDFDYGNLAELSEAWIGRAYARLPRFGPEMPPLLAAMLPLLQCVQPLHRPLAGNQANVCTTCARLVYDLLEAGGATPVIDADRDLATATNLDEELRATRMFITPGDLLTSPSLEPQALLVLQY